MPVTVVPRQKALERCEQITFGSGTGLHDGQTGCGVRGQHVDQTVAPAGAEPGELVGEVDGAGTGGVDFDLA